MRLPQWVIVLCLLFSASSVLHDLSNCIHILFFSFSWQLHLKNLLLFQQILKSIITALCDYLLACDGFLTCTPLTKNQGREASAAHNPERSSRWRKLIDFFFTFCNAIYVMWAWQLNAKSANYLTKRRVFYLGIMMSIFGDR